ncbi:SulP family inorganic anion transporter [Sulfurimonas sp.]|jgi:MFS superfamily sulfate permease-like transporter|uniref:SulP family inorganic anion transporter n=1 Tax=Sulfurimonas sp. TaxID=2022749 RepID=UPI0025E1E42A|nr:SulP family inorganic anion transporter [Sulfurimonas sp.]MBT5935138.1 SulP family inorganic anion transporter [Sulfurimonas sp.]
MKNENTKQNQNIDYGSAAFVAKYASRDLQAGVITATMAIPLSIGIALMSDYPIQVGLATVAFASFIAFIFAIFRPGNYVGAPGIAAGLAPILAMGVATFGMENMAFIVFMTATFQALIWSFNWQRYLLRAVPPYLVEGLLAGIGLKIALKFLPYLWMLPAGMSVGEEFWSDARLQVIALSIVGAIIFLLLFKKFKDTKPALPYFTLIVYGIVASVFVDVKMLMVEDVDFALSLPIPEFDSLYLWIYAIFFSLMLAVVDVIEQVMSNAAIEKIDPLERPSNSNNSLLSIWVSNMGSSFFGGMTNLDGLAKSSTNRLAGAYTKLSVLVIGVLITFFVFNSQYLHYLPYFALAIIMSFVGIKMFLGLLHVATFGPYAVLLATVCAGLVFKVGIFEGLIVTLVIHAVISYVIFSEIDSMPAGTIVSKYFQKFKEEDQELN